MGAPGVGHRAIGRTERERESMWDTVFSVCRPVYPPRARSRNLPPQPSLQPPFLPPLWASSRHVELV